jgi:hypothetical protein
MAFNNRLAIAAASLAALAVCSGCQRNAAASQASAAPVATPRDPQNSLIGRWRFIGIGTGPASSPSGCSIDMTFTPTQWTQTQAGATTTGNVTYVAGSSRPAPSTVYVVDPAGGHVTYVLIDHSHIALDSFAPCTYVRVA